MHPSKTTSLFDYLVGASKQRQAKGGYLNVAKFPGKDNSAVAESNRRRERSAQFCARNRREAAIRIEHSVHNHRN